MARKSKKLVPDSDGYLRTGIYRKYVGKPKPEFQLTPANAQAYVDRLNSPASDDVKRIRDWLWSIVEPYLDGPLGNQERLCPGDRSVGFGDGKWYRVKAELQQQDRHVIDAFEDAVSALGDIKVIETHLGSDGRINWLFRATFRLGQLCERIGVRPFENAAKIGLKKSEKSRRQAIQTNDKRAARRPDYTSEVRAVMDQGSKYDPACQQVAAKFDVTKETVRNNTPELRPRKPKSK
jgi:hypothetical protein